MDKSILKDVSSNSYYIPLATRYNNDIYEIVIPNDRLFSILSKELGEEFDLDSYVKLIAPVVCKQKQFELSKKTLNKVTPYILPPNWDVKVIDISKLFTNDVQSSIIDDELILIRQLIEKGYLVYKDDETGLLVKRVFK